MLFNNEFFVCYLRITQGCNLDCDHCFTLGKQDDLDYITPEDVDRFCKIIHDRIGPEKMVFYLHGGETFLINYDVLEQILKIIKGYFGDQVIIVPQTNLLITIDEQFIQLIKKYCDNHVAISWDQRIRFPSQDHEDRFFRNLDLLISNDIRHAVAITLQKYLIEETDPVEVLRLFPNADTIDFEYLTVLNEKTKHLNDIDMELYYQYLEKIYDAYMSGEFKFGLPFIDLIYRNIKRGQFAHCKCNCCNERTITMNVNGTIGLCPDMAYVDPMSTLDEMEKDWDTFCTKAIDMVAERKATEFNPFCLKCESYEICGGNCDFGLVRDEHCFINDVLIRRVRDDIASWKEHMKFGNYIELYKDNKYE